MTGGGFNLQDGMELLGIGYADLWQRYIALGGNNTEAVMREHILSVGCPDPHEHDVIAQAINEAYLERGQDHPVAYYHADTDNR